MIFERPLEWSRDVIRYSGRATRLATEEGQTLFASPLRSNWDSPGHIFIGYLGGKVAGREADHSKSSSANGKNAWSYTFSLPSVFMACCLITTTDNFTITFMGFRTLLNKPVSVASPGCHNVGENGLGLFSPTFETDMKRCKGMAALVVYIFALMHNLRENYL